MAARPNFRGEARAADKGIIWSGAPVTGEAQHLAKVGVVSSNLIARSNKTKVQPGHMGDRSFLGHG